MTPPQSSSPPLRPAVVPMDAGTSARIDTPAVIPANAGIPAPEVPVKPGTTRVSRTAIPS